MGTPMRGLMLACVLLVSCKENAQPGGPAEVQLASNLNTALVDTALNQISRSGGPRAERAATADVRWDDEPYEAIAAAAHGELMPAPATAADVPPLWKDPNGTWVAVGGRAVVLLVGTDNLGDHGAPVRFTALSDGWLKGKVALAAPTGGMALAHFAALYRAWGPERMEIWLRQLKANEPQIYDNDDQVRQAVVSGRAVVGIVASDEAAKAAASAAHVVAIYPNQKSSGTFVWPTALSVAKSAKNPEAAQKLAERLADRNTEQLLVARLPGYLPLRSGIPVPPGVRSAANLVVISVDPAVIMAEIAGRKASLAAWAASIPRPGPASAQATQ
jgi:ABC-type Fe3+ transport system substrate-binding protein